MSESAESVEDFWGPPIHVITRRQLLEDGTLVDLRTKPIPANEGPGLPEVCAPDLDEVVRNAGIVLPLACTAEVFNECIDVTPAAKAMGCDVKGRLWDICWMFSQAAKRSRGESELLFIVYIVRNRARAEKTTLKAVCEPGDDAEPVLTISWPEQD